MYIMLHKNVVFLYAKYNFRKNYLFKVSNKPINIKKKPFTSNSFSTLSNRKKCIGTYIKYVKNIKNVYKRKKTHTIIAQKLKNNHIYCYKFLLYCLFENCSVSL